MQIKSAQFIKSIAGTDVILNDPYPQIGFIGRSNVGKSSLINSLTNRKDLVKVSSEPGKTKRINFFLINEAYYFVDLPGYGYARRSQKEAEKLRQWIVWYIQTDEVRNKKIVLVLDIKVGITPFDQEVIELLSQNKTPFVIAATKSDSLKNAEIAVQIEKIKQQIPLALNIPVIIYSSKNNTGRDALTSQLLAR